MNPTPDPFDDDEKIAAALAKAQRDATRHHQAMGRDIIHDGNRPDGPVSDRHSASPDRRIDEEG